MNSSLQQFVLSCYSMQMRKWRGPLLATLVLVASCGDDDEEATPTTTESPATSAVTTTTEVVDPFTVPDDPADITEAYVEAIANELYVVLAEANAIQVEGGDPQEIVRRYNDVYVPEVADVQLNDAFSRTEEDLARFKQPPGAQKVTISAILEVTDRCVVAKGTRSAEEVLKEPPPPLDGYLVLIRREENDSGLNETPWLLKGFSPLTEEVTCGES